MTSVTPADLPAAVGSAGSSAALAGASPISLTAAVALSLDDARRMTLRAQGFVGASARKGGVPGMLRRVGGVQLDTISVLARSHELVAYARLGAIPRERIERAYWNPAHPSAFEYWAHAACVLPIEEWPYYAFRRRWFRARGMRWHEVSPRVCEQVLAQVRAEGPLTATQLGGAKGGGPWWDWSAVKVAAEWLLDIGELACVRRTGWRRVYDLPERTVPAELLAAEPSDEECVSHLVGVAARALGVATHADLTDYHRLQRRLPGGSARAPALDDAARAAGLTPVTIPGPRGDLAAWADPAALAAAGGGRREHHRVTLLSPFDSLIWDRKRTARLFGFEHSLEAYVPKAKRVHGYFVMPLLAGGRLVGRVDPVRRGSTLVARQVSLDRPSAAGPMARALREAAESVGCDQVGVERVTPADSTTRLRALLGLRRGAIPAPGNSAELDELFPDGDHDGFHPGVDLQFLQDVAHVVLHGVLGDEQFLGDVPVVHAPRDQLEDLHLPVGELGRGNLLRALLLGVAAGQRGELGEQLARHGGVDERLAAVHGPHGVGYLIERDVLEQVAAGS